MAVKQKNRATVKYQLDLAKRLDARRHLQPIFNKKGQELANLRLVYVECGELALFNEQLSARDNKDRQSFEIFPASFIFADNAAAADNTAVTWTGVNSGPATFMMVFSIYLIAGPIIEELRPSMADITSLGMTSKPVARVVASWTAVWNIMSEAPPPYIPERGVTTKSTIQDRGLVITSSGWNTETEQSYCARLAAMIKVFQSDFSDFRHITFHKLPFFNVKAFELLVQQMPNLETVSIQQCLLMDYTKLPSLLRVIAANPRSPGAKHGYIRFDFGPQFFAGPNDPNRKGSYGVTHHVPTFHIPKSVFALVLGCRQVCKMVGFDPLDLHESFFTFVCRLPGPELWAFKARDAVIAWEVEIARGQGPEDEVQLWNRFTADLTAALSGDNVELGNLPRKMRRLQKSAPSIDYRQERQQCTSCRASPPLSLFRYKTRDCYGCQAVQFVNECEDSHFRHWINAATNAYLYPGAKDSTPVYMRGLNPNTPVSRAAETARLEKITQQTSGNLQQPAAAAQQPNYESQSTTAADGGRVHWVVPQSPHENTALQVLINWSTRSCEEEEYSMKLGFWIARHIDNCHRYYKNIEPGKLAPLYPEPVAEGSDNIGASLRRLHYRMHQEFGPVDHSQGGPQREHPAKKPSTLCTTPAGQTVIQPEELFNHGFGWNRKTDEMWGRAFIKRVMNGYQGNKETDPDFIPTGYLHHPRVINELWDVVKNPRREEDRRMVMHEVRMRQNEFDRDVMMWSRGRVENDLHLMWCPGNQSFSNDNAWNGRDPKWESTPHR
ncbi:hypothetical protein B0T26DRAFT_746688 [Lasiosphaeria miniovina]|uniref:Uncharacterized protein n=1 Tax=Lasiosphaeria miniovina TaxID=1954250 RepID=A0AA40BIG7_9PEZI|nr:uncharacterized protein B0T26DRAFT_746688 [Lasiosphaeria miniovina]KAK0734829.1 hypothetical protein B0T26DRAFT_746688 [Lasiosphaeria miniovina]